MRINWTALAAITPLLIVMLGWSVSIEVRMSQHSNIQNLENEINAMKLENHQNCQTTSNQINAFTTEARGFVRRLQNVEEILTPVLIDYKVRKEMEKAAATGMLEIPLPPPPAAAMVDPSKSEPEVAADVEPKPAPKSIAKTEAKVAVPSKFNLLPKPGHIIEERAMKWAQEAIQRGQQVPSKASKKN